MFWVMCKIAIMFRNVEDIMFKILSKIGNLHMFKFETNVYKS